jgi:hypothetical protein
MDRFTVEMLATYAEEYFGVHEYLKWSGNKKTHTHSIICLLINRQAYIYDTYGVVTSFVTFVGHKIHSVAEEKKICERIIIISYK